MGLHQPSILLLPADVVTRIKSSTTIESLKHVVLELIANSLDAKAGQIDLVVDFVRGDCTVDDDGQGIMPVEFGECGGLGKLYYTSKYHLKEPSLGCNGTFLASLAALSLVTITSRHHQHRSTNSITFHRSEIIQRNVPAPVHDQVSVKHGTRVVVRNLFGNLPVRVKHRSIILDRKSEYDRLWTNLRRDIASLLISWQGTTAIRVRNGEQKQMFNFSTSGITLSSNNHYCDTSKFRSVQFNSILNILTQADIISVSDWASWVPASARTSTFSVRGAISLRPAPSKDVQFISINLHPLLAESGHNELFDHINRLFALSDFGAIETNDRHKLEVTYQRPDKRYTSNFHTDRQLKGRKHVDRHPMFCFSIMPEGAHKAKTSVDRLFESQADLQAILEVTSVMIRQWLSVYHFRPKLPQRKRTRPVALSCSVSQVAESKSATSTTNQQTLSPPSRNTFSFSPNSTVSNSKKDVSSTTLSRPPKVVQRLAFAEWSRVKSGRAESFSNHVTSQASLSTALTKSDWFGSSQIVPSLDTESFSSLKTKPVSQGMLGLLKAGGDAFGEETVNGSDESNQINRQSDSPSKAAFVSSLRTESVLANTQGRNHSELNSATSPTSKNSLEKRLLLDPSPVAIVPAKHLWLNEVLQNWNNPVFKHSEPRIRRAFSNNQDGETGAGHRSVQCRSHVCEEQGFNKNLESHTCRLSKEGLWNAQVIAQVDRKFILAKMWDFSGPNTFGKPLPELLVLIDQHAADERVQVETLWKEFCTPATELSQNTCQSKLGHKAGTTSLALERPIQFSISAEEQKHFDTHAARFAAWGILYNLLHHQPLVSSKLEHRARSQSLLSVTSLSPIISSRCTSDPKILISLLRSTVWYFVLNPHLLLPFPPPPPPPSSHDPSHIGPHDPASWVRRAANCPPALVDMLNSRACRSAIMFNDELSKEECEGLVRRLANCVFPFTCAHGRPSMIPVGDLRQVKVGVGKADEMGEEKSFVQAWKAWKR